MVATNNQGKLRELQKLLGSEVELQSLGEHSIQELPEETGSTYEENARIKAEFVARQTGLPSVADDSGLEVDALPGELGVRSARFVQGTDAERIAELLRRLQGNEQRSARFVAVIAYAEPNAPTHFFRGEIQGRITESPRGSEGFGYDPVFTPNGFEQTFAEMSAEQKNSMSHRANAALKLRAWLTQKG